MEKIKVGLIGCGWIGMGAEEDILRPVPASHAEAILHHEGFELSALYDPGPHAKSDAARLHPEVEFYDVISDFFASGVQAAVIASDAGSHIKLIETCLAHNIKHILCEKPIANDLFEAKRLDKLVQENSANVVVNHMRRFSPEIVRLRRYIRRERIRDTAIGDILSGHAYYDKGLFHCGTHIIDLLIFLLGDVLEVVAISSPQFEADENDLSSEALLFFNSCCISLKPFDSTHYAVTEVVLYGESGRVALTDMWGRVISIAGLRQARDFSAYNEIDEDSARTILNDEPFMVSTYRHFYLTIVGNEPDNSLADSINTLKVIAAIKESSLNEGRRIMLNHE
jgi:predicted dehydrogenase